MPTPDDPIRQVTFQTCQFDNCGPDCGFAAPTDPCKCPCHESPLPVEIVVRKASWDKMEARVMELLRERDELRAENGKLIETLAGMLYNWAGVRAHDSRMETDRDAAVTRLLEDADHGN